MMLLLLDAGLMLLVILSRQTCGTKIVFGAGHGQLLLRLTSSVIRNDPRHVDAPFWSRIQRTRKTSNLAPIQTDILETFFGLGEYRRISLRARVQTKE